MCAAKALIKTKKRYDSATEKILNTDNRQHQNTLFFNDPRTPNRDGASTSVFFRDDASRKLENGKSLENSKIENIRLLRRGRSSSFDKADFPRPAKRTPAARSI